MAPLAHEQSPPTASFNEARGSWADPRRLTSAYHSTKPFHHIKDIVALAKPRLDPNASLPDCLAECEKCYQTAKTMLDFGRPDASFRNYLTASEIALNVIPRHKEYGFWSDNNRKWADRYNTVLRGLRTLDPQMGSVRHLIEDNNDRNGTQQMSDGSQLQHGSRTTPNDLSQVSHSTSQDTVDRRLSNELPASLRIEKARPASVIKPQQLRGEAISGSNDLHSRLARLRISGQNQNGGRVLSMPKAGDFQSEARSSRYDNTSVANATQPGGRPAGPREMPSAQAPYIPAKVPLSSTVPMPKPPSPTYSPSTSTISNGFHDPSHRLPLEKRQTYYDQPIQAIHVAQLQKSKDESPYRPRTPNGHNPAIVVKSRSSEIPYNTLIDAEVLASYMQRYNVLLVDVRERALFDDGHIFATSIICVEPLSLKEGVSAEALEERLILSPETELNLFSRRNEFDLVVYYDQSSDNDRYIRGHPTHNNAPHLRALYDTLYEFNEYKPLKDGRPPALLRGGLDAWVDLMSEQSLARSKTAVMLGSTRQRAPSIGSRALGRQRIASTNSRYEIRNRRLKDHNFLDESEQAAWREKAEQEQVTTDSHMDYSEEYADEPVPESPFVPDYEAFLRRFPAVDQQSMTLPPRHPASSMQAPPVPTYEPPPVPALPTIPTRPAPAIPRPSYSGQSEIIQTQAPLARVTSGNRQPLYSSALAARTKKIPITGLTNFGVTCYMNSTLQCLSATIPLASFFMDEPRYRSNVQKNWKGSSGIMPEIFANVVRSLWKGDVQVIKPTTFRNFCGRMNREWVIDRQQDAKEFFDFLVDCLHEDLNLNWERNPLRPLTTAEEMQREKFSIPEAGPIEWKRYEHRDYSFISSLFAGQHASRLKCLACRNTSTTYEPFYSISIEIPKSGMGDIYQCLRSYTQEERLTEQWRCPYCKCEREATKQIILTRLPQFLVVHFKRFSASKTERARKIHTPIDFPLHGLNMDPFIVPHASSAKQSPRRSQEISSPQIDPATTGPFTFDAYGVLRHLGNSGDGGHYVSMVKDAGRDCWRKFDDERHYNFDPSRMSRKDGLQNGEAYIVFYQRSLAR